MRALAGHSIETNIIYGIYLPILWESKRCCKSPIVLGYMNCHFVPLLPLEDPHGQNQCHCAVPLVAGSTMERIPVRLLLEDEEANSSRLLLEYLDITDIKYSGIRDSMNCFQAAKLSPDTFKDFNIMELAFKQFEKSFQEDEEMRSRVSEEIPCERDTDRRPECNLDPYRSKSAAPSESKTLQNAALNTAQAPGVNRNTPKCIKSSCQYAGTKEQFDLCSQCYKQYLEQTRPERDRLKRHRQSSTSANRHSAPMPSSVVIAQHFRDPDGELLSRFFISLLMSHFSNL